VSADLLTTETTARLTAARDTLIIRTMQFGMREGHRAATRGGAVLPFAEFKALLKPYVDAFTDALNAEIIAANALAYELALREEGIAADVARARAEGLIGRLRKMAELDS